MISGRILRTGESIPISGDGIRSGAYGSAVNTVALICEGYCNPSIHVVDAFVADARKKLPNGGPLPAGLTLDRVKALKHTPHVEAGKRLYRCVACGAERIY